MAEDNLRKVLWSENFDGLTAPKSNWQVNIADNDTYLLNWNAISSSTGINDIKFENGKLVMVKQQQFTGTDYLMTIIPIENFTMPTAGYVSISFDYTQDSQWGTNYDSDIYIENSDQEYITGLCFGSSDIGLIDTTNLPYGDFSQRITPDTSLYVGKTIHIEIVYCIDNHTYNVYYTSENGIRTKASQTDMPICGIILDFSKIYIKQNCDSVAALPPVTVCYDNFEIAEYQSVSKKLKAVADKIRTLTGKTDSLTLDDMANLIPSSVNNGDITDKIIEGSIAELTNDNATTIRQYAFYCQENLKTAKFQRVKTCYESAFYGCNLLERVELPSVIGIYGGVFASTPSLKAIIIGTQQCDLPSIAAFEACGSLYTSGVTIYVPDSAVNAYKNATNWSYYASQIKAVSELEG